ncbi:hypothetical protein [Parasphingorhabdus sp.]|uniref:hypothetical protein n=1 Tax=Parasphingorhabdus sp. TaxID=2709688 RepID=UPI0032633EBD
MVEIGLTQPKNDEADAAPQEEAALAAGLFGYSICDGRMRSLKPTEGYLRDIEQMPNFATPSVSSFVAQYLASNINKRGAAS